jgi:hypothetical protein
MRRTHQRGAPEAQIKNRAPQRRAVGTAAAPQRLGAADRGRVGVCVGVWVGGGGGGGVGWGGGGCRRSAGGPAAWGSGLTMGRRVWRWGSCADRALFKSRGGRLTI